MKLVIESTKTEAGKRVLPMIEDVKKMYDESKNEVENKKEEWEKKREEENIEPTGYLCFEKLLTKYGNEALVRRYGCSAHHPFD